ncbi:MAG: hypothetical protein F6K38_12460 [Moorea sp. SIO3B2]|nr:hypothetical protein [Moorena producens]NEP32247.1 hypothetical protein [Moorena sp. SIO3B2]NEQ09338.1 hypothetical protein [Moorena sp. SIO4E2]
MGSGSVPRKRVITNSIPQSAIAHRQWDKCDALEEPLREHTLGNINTT